MTDYQRVLNVCLSWLKIATAIHFSQFFCLLFSFASCVAGIAPSHLRVNVLNGRKRADGNNCGVCKLNDIFLGSRTLETEQTWHCRVQYNIHKSI